MANPVAIVGGGLAGLVAAHELESNGIDYVVLEARDRLGGRILSLGRSGEPSTDGFDLGPSWFWPNEQPIVEQLRVQLGLSSFPQYGFGHILVQRMSREATQRLSGMQPTMGTMRIGGGTGSLIAALDQRIPVTKVRLQQRVTALELCASGIELTIESHSNGAIYQSASHVVFALPPRLLSSSVSFFPSVDQKTVELWRGTPTWMAPHAKFFAIYDRPFWREAGLSGTAQSMVGPLAEIHDATSESGQAALFGFVGIPAGQRQNLGQAALIEASIAQLAELFGPAAATPQATLLKDWANDPLTATKDDQFAGGHPTPGHKQWVTGAWQDTIVLAGSETSPSEPGYLAGAIKAGQIAASEIIRRLEPATVSATPESKFAN